MTFSAPPHAPPTTSRRMVAVGALLLALLGAVALFGPESVGVSTTSFGVAEKIEAAMQCSRAERGRDSRAGGVFESYYNPK